MRLALSVIAGLVVATGCSSSTEPALPGCLKVQGQFDARAPGYIIEYKQGTDPVTITEQLSRKYSFQPTQVYQSLPGFAALLSKQAVLGISCEPSVALIEHDGIAYLAAQLR